MGKVKIIKASAGSGKTFRLAYEYILRVVRQPQKYRHILAVTFTNMATEEMKRRILSELNDLALGNNTLYMDMIRKETGYERQEISSRAKSARTLILHDYGRFSILTIDKFFQKIIRSFIKELGIDLNFNLELQTDSLLSKTADVFIEGLAENEELRKWISGYIEERIESNLQWDIKKGLVVMARELFRENFKTIAADTPDMVSIRNILRKAAGKYNATVSRMKSEAMEALDIIDGAGLTPEDFVYGKGGVSGYLLKIGQGRIEEYGTRVKKAMESDEAWSSKASPVKESILMVAPYLREKLTNICGVYDENFRFMATYELLKDNYRRFALLGSLARIMEEICARDSIMPISETNSILSKLISGNDSPFIFEKAGNHFDTFMIDEFQDTSSLQWENFYPLLNNAVAQDSGSPVLLVGDVKQSIYRWRGGDWKILSEEVETRFSETGNENLSENWRSRPAVVNFNNCLLESIVGQVDSTVNQVLKEAEDKDLLTAEKTGQLQGLIQSAYQSHKQTSCGKTEGGHITVTYYNGGQETCPPVIRQIEQLQDRCFRAGDIAILVRRNNEGTQIADMLLEHKSKHPGSRYCYDVVTQEALAIGSSPAVNFIISCMRLAAGDEDIPEKVYYNKYLRRDFGARLPEEESGFISSLRSKPTSDAFEEIVRTYALGTAENAAYLQALHDQILDWTGSHVGDMPLFIKWWDENGATQSVNAPSNGNAITIVSIHKSKGLEYPVVIIPFCDWSLTPHSRSIIWSRTGEGEFSGLGNVPVPYSEKMGTSHFSESFYEELVMSCIDNINLFYVAATRARDELHIMMPVQAKASLKISSFMSQFLNPNDLPEVLEGAVQFMEEETIISFGSPVYPREKKADENAGMEIISVPFHSFDIESRVKQKRSYLRFEQDGLVPTISPMNYGILLHGIFEKAEKREDVFAAINDMVKNGEITEQEKCGLSVMVENALKNPLARKWFDGSARNVYRERDIIIPGSHFTRRPDRVMEYADEIVVVDYKFGNIRDNGHHKQVGYYKTVLQQMTAKPVTGYIWYVTLDEIARVGT